MVGSVDILWHGRGGQGAFTASRILGAAYVSGEGGSALAFPSFGPERRGAPMRAFTKLSMDTVSDRSEIVSPDYEIFLDDGLLSGIRDDGRIVIVNSSEEGADGNIVRVDGTGIARSVTGVPIANTAMVGAFAAVWDGISLDSVNEGIRSVMPGKLWDSNIEVARQTFERVRGLIG